jgi:formylmethanofuran dehydrogenase subunit E
MPVEVIKDPKAEAADVDMVVCIRVIDKPLTPEMAAKGVVTDDCSECGEKVWVAPTSPSEPKRVCSQCADKLIREDGDEPHILVSEQYMRRWFSN